MYKILLIGTGAEVTQGFLPIDVVESIFQDMEDSVSLNDYLLEALEDANKLDWYEIDDNFHYTGAFLSKSKIVILDKQNRIIKEIASDKISFEEDITDEIYPNSSFSSDLAVLTCADSSYGTFFTATINEKINTSLLKLKVKTLSDSYSIIHEVEYNGSTLIDETTECRISKEFIVSLQN